MHSIYCSCFLIAPRKLEMHGSRMVANLTEAQRSACLDKSAGALLWLADMSRTNTTVTEHSTVSDTSK